MWQGLRLEYQQKPDIYVGHFHIKMVVKGICNYSLSTGIPCVAVNLFLLKWPEYCFLLQKKRRRKRERKAVTEVQRKCVSRGHGGSPSALRHRQGNISSSTCLEMSLVSSGAPHLLVLMETPVTYTDFLPLVLKLYFWGISDLNLSTSKIIVWDSSAGIAGSVLRVTAFWSLANWCHQQPSKARKPLQEKYPPSLRKLLQLLFFCYFASNGTVFIHFVVPCFIIL